MYVMLLWVKKLSSLTILWWFPFMKISQPLSHEFCSEFTHLEKAQDDMYGQLCEQLLGNFGMEHYNVIGC